MSTPSAADPSPLDRPRSPGPAKEMVPTVGGPLAATRARPPAGVPTAGRAVLLPGFTGSKEDFLPLLDPLAAAGVDVLAYDQRGQLESDGPTGPEAYTLDAFATDLLAVLAHAREPVHVVGHSFGGLVARAALLARPEAFASLTLLCSGPAALPGSRAQRLELLEQVLDAAGPEGVWAAMEAEAEQDPGHEQVPAAVRAFLRHRFFATTPGCLRGMGRTLLDEPDRTAALREAARAHDVPLVVACGADDDAWPPQLQAEMAERLGCPFEAIAGAAHSPAVEQPDATVDLLLRTWGRRA